MTNFLKFIFILLTLINNLFAEDDEKAFENELKSLPEWENVEYFGQVDRKKMFEIFSKSCVGIIPFLPEPNHVNATPNKFFEYLSAGLPIVISNFPKWQSFIDKHDVGATFEPGNPEDLGKKLREILDKRQELDELGQKAKNLVIEKRNWDNEYKKIKNLYERILK